MGASKTPTDASEMTPTDARESKDVQAESSNAQAGCKASYKEARTDRKEAQTDKMNNKAKTNSKAFNKGKERESQAPTSGVILLLSGIAASPKNGDPKFARKRLKSKGVSILSLYS